jgi:hypothetical protein
MHGMSLAIGCPSPVHTESDAVATIKLKGDRTMGHHKIAAAIFVSSLVLGAAIILAAELFKPPRYEFHPNAEPSGYLIFDNDTGRATVTQVDTKTPLSGLEH